MKLFMLLFLISSATNLSSQCSQSVTIENQTDLSNFISSNPNCHDLEGSISIIGNLEDYSALDFFSSVGQNIQISNIDNVDSLKLFNNLETIGKSFSIYDTKVKDISGFSTLDSIGQFLSISDNDSLQTVGSFEELKSVGYLSIENNDLLTNIISDSKIKIQHTINIKDNGLLNTDFCLASDTMSTIYIANNSDLQNVSCLTPIKKASNIEVSFSSKIDSIIMDSLDIVSNNLYLRFLGGTRKISAKNLTSSNSLIIGLIDTIDYLNFNNLDTVHNEMVLGNIDQIESLHAFNDLHYIGGDLTLTRIPEVSTMKLSDKVIEIGGYFLIDHIQNQNLVGLENIHKVYGRLQISNNKNLSTLDGIQNIQPEFLTDGNFSDGLIISNNKLLKTCEILCPFLFQEGYEKTITNNAVGCNHEYEIDCHDFGLSGRIFFDVNQDEILSLQEPFVPFIPIIEELTGDFIYSSQAGIWYREASEGEMFSFSYLENEEYDLSYPFSNYSKTYDPNDPTNNQLDFGVYPKNPIHNIKTYLDNTFVICNDTSSTLLLQIENVGSFEESGFIEFFYGDLLTPKPVDDENIEINLQEKKVKVYIENLHVFYKKEQSILFEPLDENNTGEIIDLAIDSYVYVNGDSILTDQYQHQTELLCGFDPNDKLVSPVPIGEKKLTKKGSPFRYTIRFQNTGNFVTKDILILDTLDAHLELSSFKLENASHPVHLSRTDEGILSFLFSNINLPDSTSSFSESQGWINYTINHDPNIADSTLIENTAYIYFDQNAPIKTNTTQNLIVDEILSFESIDSEEISIYPNPSVQEIRIKGMSAQELMRIKILDINGRLLSDSNPNSLVIDVSALSKGIYFIEVHSRQSKSILKFIKI